MAAKETYTSFNVVCFCIHNLTLCTHLLCRHTYVPPVWVCGSVFCVYNTQKQEEEETYEVVVEEEAYVPHLCVVMSFVYTIQHLCRGCREISILDIGASRIYLCVRACVHVCIFNIILNICLYACVYMFMYGCIYVCVYIYQKLQSIPFSENSFYREFILLRTRVEERGEGDCIRCQRQGRGT